jgi:two-component system OmpR family response regulator
MSSVPIVKEQDERRPEVLHLKVDGLSLEVEGGEFRAGSPQLSRRDDLLFLAMTIQNAQVVEGPPGIWNKSAGAAMVLGERTRDPDYIAGLELGAQACVILCTSRELADRIQMLFRRAGGVPSEPEETLESGDLKMCRGKRRVEWRGELVKLTSTEFTLLELLLRYNGRPVSKKELSLYALRRLPARYDRSIDVHVSNLRRKLAAFAEGKRVIQSVYPHQYQLLT